jgi:plastocyanin
MLFPLMAVALLCVAACAREEPRPAQRRHVVEIRDFLFHPASLTVHAGDTVVWMNQDAVPHTVTGAGREWDSGSISAGGSWSRSVSEAGAEAYICSFHPTMTGTVLSVVDG